jgi:hypothetical protein
MPLAIGACTFLWWLGVPGEPYARLVGVGSDSSDTESGELGAKECGGRMCEHGVLGLPKLLCRAAVPATEDCAFGMSGTSSDAGESPDFEGEMRS